MAGGNNQLTIYRRPGPSSNSVGLDPHIFPTSGSVLPRKSQRAARPTDRTANRAPFAVASRAPIEPASARADGGDTPEEEAMELASGCLPNQFDVSSWRSRLASFVL